MFYLLLALMFLSPKDSKWFEVSSDHFLLFTDTNEMKGRRLLTDLENRVAAFSRAFGEVPPRQYPIEVFLFKEEVDFIEALPHVKPPDPNVVTVRQPVGPRGLPPGFPGGGGIPRDPGIPGGGGTPGGGGIPGGVGLPPGAGTPFPDRSAAQEQLSKAAYLIRGPDRIFIVARDKSPDAITNDVGHALGHVLFERYAIWRPFWLAEGAAEYMRKIGHGADTKAIAEDDAFSASDMFTIVPSATYKDDDPPTSFRTEAYRLTRLLLEDKPELVRQYMADLHKESDKAPKFPGEADGIDSKLKGYVETPLSPTGTAPAVKSVEADTAKLAIHRGDLLLASERDSDAGRWYNADSKDARAARAILTKFSRPGPEAVRALDRASRELPDNGLVQYHFGSMTIEEKKDIQSQVAALERAVKLLPLMGRAFAELARVDALNGQPEKSLPLIVKALELEPEYADRFYEIRADADLALGKPRDALNDISVAADLPHADRSILEGYAVKVSAIRRRIEMLRRDADQRDLDQISKEVRDKRAELEPPPKPAPPPAPVPEGNISYEIETRAPIEVVDATYPDYPELLRAKHTTGTIALRVDIGPDGKVRTAAIATSQIPDLNNATTDAVKKWVFKPGNRSIRLVLKFSLQ
jgi:TonB family protein